jgi:arylsulfatase A-like enzyme
MATVLDLTGAKYPNERLGQAVLPIDGIPLTPAFEGKSLARSSPLFHEHEDHAFVRDGDWKLVGRKVSPADGLQRDRWELYHITHDGTELNDLVSTHPDKVADLSAQWEAWAKRVHVYPKPKRK